MFLSSITVSFWRDFSWRQERHMRMSLKVYWLLRQMYWMGSVGCFGQGLSGAMKASITMFMGGEVGLLLLGGGGMGLKRV